MAADVVGKQFEILKESTPAVARIAVLWNLANPGGKSQLREAEAAAAALGVRLQALEARDSHQIENAFAAMQDEGVGALMILADGFLGNQRAQLAELSTKSRLPSVSWNREYAEAGGLFGYGADFLDLERRAATYVDKILKGAKPADLPIEQPTKFELVINLKTANALGLTVPPSLLARADEVIE